VEEGEDSENEGEDEGGVVEEAPSTPAVVASPPMEEHLAHNTMWPEADKLYGHAAEATCIASAVGCDLFASGCSAFRQGEATVCIWQLGVSKPLAVLRGHRAPITAVAITADGTLVASAGFDLSLAIWSAAVPGRWSLTARIERTFKKPPLACTWSLVAKQRLLAVAGGDDVGVTLFAISSPTECSPCGVVPTATRSSAVAWNPDAQLLAVGEESGAISLWSVGHLTNVQVLALPGHLSHSGAVRCLDWLQQPTATTSRKLTLASGGDDGFVRISHIRVVNADGGHA